LSSTADFPVLSASDGIVLTGALALTGPGADQFRGVRVVGDTLMLTAAAVPEPSSAALLLAALSSLAIGRRRRGLTIAGKVCCATAILIAVQTWATLANALEMTPRKVLSTYGSDRATRLVQSNKIATLDGITHVSWMDFDDKVQINSYNAALDEWSGTSTIGIGQDNHGPASIAFDSEGYIHAIFGPHNSSFQYAVSAQPNDASSWIPQGTLGNFATYPSMVIDANDTIHFTYRGGVNAVFPQSLFYQQLPKDGVWSQPTMLANTGPEYINYAHYHQSMGIGPNGEIHLAYDIFRYHNPSPYARAAGAGHMMSLDGGTTWETIDGEVLTQPVQPGSDVYYRTTDAPNGLSSNNIVIDSQGNPWISVWDYDDQAYSTSYLYHHDGAAWKSYRIDDLLPAAYSGMRFSSDFAVGLDENDGIYIAGNMNGNVAVLYGADPDDGPFDLLIVDPAKAGFSPQGINIERNVGHNDVDTPRISYYSGTDGSPSTVYTVQLINEGDLRSRSWRINGSGIWNFASSWTPSTAPNGSAFRAIFGPSIAAPSTVIVDTNVTANALTFNSSHSYALAGNGTVLLEGQDAGILVAEGEHQLQTELVLQSDASVDVVAGSFAFNNQIDLAGNTLTLLGEVAINHSVIDSVGGGSILNVGTLTTLDGGELAADLTSVGTLAFSGLDADSVGSALRIAGKADLRGVIELDFADGEVPVGSRSILTAYEGITLTGPLTLSGPDAAQFRGVQIVGNSLVLTAYAVPEPAAISLWIVGQAFVGFSFAGSWRFLATSVSFSGVRRESSRGSHSGSTWPENISVTRVNQ
jgi:hypothetical protein